MTREKLLEKAREFEKKNKNFTWKPNDFPEDMTLKRAILMSLYQKEITCMKL